jgi:SAM-dependent methyltransferase
MPLATNDRQFLEKQYRDPRNLDARINLHRHFSTDPYGWHPWVFDHLDLPPSCRILELGCGPGHLWLENLARIPAGWQILLSDFSSGMLEAARQNLEDRGSFQFKVIDAQAIPLEDASFDAVIANHMLYHVPNRPVALAEIRRVLKPAGAFHASAGGQHHLVEIRAMLVKFDPVLSAWGRGGEPFTLENGSDQLSSYFAAVRVDRYKAALQVTEAAPLVDYVLSGWSLQVLAGRQAEFSEFVDHEITEHGGVLHITEDGGLFTGVRKEWAE